MYNGIGLQTPRGSGTNGYIQTNKFFVKAKLNKISENTRGFEAGEGTAGLTRKANKDILEHDRKRQIELKLAVLEDTLSEQGFPDADIAKRILEERKILEAAIASDEIVEKKSKTQTHQVVARKEKQMETLRAALGISDPSEQVEEGEIDDRKFDDGKPREHSFLDRDVIRRKPRVDDDSKSGKDDKKKSAKDVKSRREKGEGDELDNARKHKKKEKSRNYDDDDDSDSSASDTDDSEKNVRGSRKKTRRYRKDDSESESDVDIGTKKKKAKSSKKQSRSRRYDSDSSSGTDASDSTGTDSESGSDIDIGRKKKKTKSSKRPSRSRRHDTDDSDSASGSDASDSDGGASDSDSGAVKARSWKNADRHKSSHRKHDSDSDDHRTMKAPPKIEIDLKKRASRRHDSDDSQSDDERRPALQTQKEKYQKHQERTRRQKDNEDDSDANALSKNKRSEVRRYKDENAGIRRGEQDDVHGGSDRETYKKKKTVSGMGKRHDSDDSDSPYVQISSRGAMCSQKAAKRQSISPSDDSLGKSSGTDSDDGDNGKKYQRFSRIPAIDDRWDMVQKSEGNDEVTRGKRKQNDDYFTEQPESKLRSRDIGKGVELEKDKQETKYEPESSRARRDRDDRRRDDLSRSIKSKVERDGNNGGQEGRTHNKDYETQFENWRGRDFEDHRGSGRHNRDEEEQGEIGKDRDYEDRVGGRKSGRDEEEDGEIRKGRDSEDRIGGRRSGRDEEDGEIRNSRDYEDRRGSRRHGRDEEDHRGRRHTRDEGDHDGKRHKEDEERQCEGRRDRRGEEEERRSRGYERERKSDYSSKRARY